MTTLFAFGACHDQDMDMDAVALLWRLKYKEDSSTLQLSKLVVKQKLNEEREKKNQLT